MTSPPAPAPHGRSATRQRTTKETSVSVALDLDGPEGKVHALECFREALGDQAGVRRFASGAFPLDEALVEVALDLSGRPFVAYDVPFGEVLPLGDPPFNPEMAEHFFQSFATQAGITLHVRLRAGRNTHHIVEATFKGVARCLRDAVRVEGGAVPSTKGTLSA